MPVKTLGHHKPTDRLLLQSFSAKLLHEFSSPGSKEDQLYPAGKQSRRMLHESSSPNNRNTNYIPPASKVGVARYTRKC